MKLLLLFFVLLLNEDLKAQFEGYIIIGREFDEVNYIMKDPCSSCYHNTICFCYYHFKGGIGKLKVIERIISISDQSETIYSSEIVDVDPTWEYYWSYYTLPEGKYRIKIYDEEGNLIGFSLTFKILL